MMKLLLLTLGTTLLTATVFSNAYYKKQQFYPTMVYLLNSNRAIGVRVCSLRYYRQRNRLRSL